MAHEPIYTFELHPTKGKTFTRSHYCGGDDNLAKHELFGMMYAMYFEHKHPSAKLYKDGKLIHSMR